MSSSTGRGWWGMRSLRAALAAVPMEWWSPRVARRVHSKLTTLDFRRADWLLQDLLGAVPWDKALEGPRKPIIIQKSPFPSSGAMHPNKKEVGQRHQQAFTDEQRAPGQSQTKGNLQRVEARTAVLGGIQRKHPASLMFA